MQNSRRKIMLVTVAGLFALTIGCALCDSALERGTAARPDLRIRQSQSPAAGPSAHPDAPMMTDVSDDSALRSDITASTISSPDVVADPSKPLKAVSRVDLKRYMGRWFEIARLPNLYQDGVVGVIAEYALRDDGRIVVRNHGRSGSLDAELTVSTATARVADNSANAKWLVQFLWPFEADYWIIDLHESYDWAVVGQPSRERLWILSRDSTMDEITLSGILRRLRANGYDTAAIELTPQRQED